MSDASPGPEVDSTDNLFRCITTPDWWVSEEGRPSSAAFKQCKNQVISFYCTDKGYTNCWETAPSAVCCSTDKTGEARDCSKPGVRVAMRDGFKVTLGRL